MRLFKINALAAVIALFLSTGCLQGVGPASTSPAASSTVSETPSSDDFTVKAAPAAPAQEGIRPKPDQVSVGGDEKEREKNTRTYYGHDPSQLSLLDDAYDAKNPFEIHVDEGPTTTLVLRIQKLEEHGETWTDVPTGQKLRLLFTPAPPLTIRGIGSDSHGVTPLYCDTSVNTVTKDNPPQYLSINQIEDIKGGTLNIMPYEESTIKNPKDCSQGWDEMLLGSADSWGLNESNLPDFPYLGEIDIISNLGFVVPAPPSPDSQTTPPPGNQMQRIQKAQPLKVPPLVGH